MDNDVPLLPLSDIDNFDLPLAEQKKRQGMKQAEEHRLTLLEQAREALIQTALTRSNREADADDAQRWIIAQGRSPSELGNAAGSLFPAETWEFTGRWKKSRRVSNHGHQNRIWRLR